MLTKSEITLILEKLADRTVVAASPAFPFTINRRGFGYSGDPEIGALQAKLSIMLEAARDE